MIRAFAKHNVSLVVRKPVFGVSDQVQHKPGCTVTEDGYNPPALLLPTVLVNIIVIVVYFYPRLRIRYPEFILVVIHMVSEARYKTLHSTSHRNLSERVGEVDTALSYEPEGRGFESLLVFFFSSHLFHAFFWILLKCSRQPRDISIILYMQLRKTQFVKLNWQPLQ